MRIPGVIFESVYIDTLHVLDLGVSLHCAANLFVEIVHELPGNRQSNLVTLRQDVMADALPIIGYHCAKLLLIAGAQPRI